MPDFELFERAALVAGAPIEFFEFGERQAAVAQAVGVSFDGLAQCQAHLALSHVNAYMRLSQSDRTPYDVLEFLYGEVTAAKLHMRRRQHIPPPRPACPAHAVQPLPHPVPTHPSQLSTSDS